MAVRISSGPRVPARWELLLALVLIVVLVVWTAVRVGGQETCDDAGTCLIPPLVIVRTTEPVIYEPGYAG